MPATCCIKNGPEGRSKVDNTYSIYGSYPTYCTVRTIVNEARLLRRQEALKASTNQSNREAISPCPAPETKV